MCIDLATTLHVLSHEIRSPVGVMHGYLRLLLDGGVNDAAKRDQVLTQMQKASSRIAALGQQASDLAEWVERQPGGPWTAFPLPDLISQALAKADPGVDVRSRVSSADEAVSIRTVDPAFLTAACGAVINAVARESGTGVLVATRQAEPGVRDLLIWPVEPGAELGGLSDTHADVAASDLRRGGLGLSLILAAAVIAAHEGKLWRLADRPAFLGIRLIEVDHR
jgi:K+-sensing histidine kinase KdpD